MREKNKESRIYLWGHERRFNAYSNYFRQLYGTRVQKVSVDAGFTCPNRDGKKGTGGCTYCDNQAFNPSYCDPVKSITQQIKEGREFHKWRYRRAVSYLAYFQSYTNTYAPLEHLRKLFMEALDYPGVIGLTIGTRPDCIGKEKLEYLGELSKDHYITVEYGIESCYNRTLERINRGHSFEEAVEILKQTAEYGIPAGAHFIFGLPGETVEDMLSMAEIISSLPLRTVKFHQLQILKNTRMEKEYRNKIQDFHIFTLEEYINFIVKFLEMLNPAIVVERFTGEVPPRFRVNEGFGNYRSEQILTLVERRLEELDTWQGRLCKTMN